LAFPAGPRDRIRARGFYSQKGRGLCAFWGDDRLALPLKDLSLDEQFQRVTALFQDDGLADGLARRSPCHLRALSSAQLCHGCFVMISVSRRGLLSVHPSGTGIADENPRGLFYRF
jgi:hypothetical protein